jgi:hypothetical protein
MHEKHKEAIRATQLMNRLDNFASAVKPGKEDPDYEVKMEAYERAQMTPSQVNAVQIILKKLVPDLSSVEQKIVDDKDSMTEAQIFEQMKALVSASPELAHQLREMLTLTVVPSQARTDVPMAPMAQKEQQS